ncbi:MAG: enoyl-CoA hydratase-related protein [Thermodesulfobacteriota bacterium]|nr:enoyl-CoA hydratase-related protein [Thermodesulfobacteriota bacterium]
MPIRGKEILIREKKDKIVIITLNRPERLNAISFELMERLEEVWKDFYEDEDSWVAVLTATGDKAFCTGYDLLDQAERDKKGLGMPKKLPAITPAGIWKPTIAAINGFAIAGGFWLAQNCDIRIAAETAEFGIAETRWNLPAYWVHDLTRELHIGHALEIALWGDRRITAQRGYEMGWINRVVPPEKLMEEAMSWAESMLYLGPRCVRNLKEIIYRSYYMTPPEGEAFGIALEQNLKGMEDTIEGPKAFAEKRKPQFKCR